MAFIWTEQRIRWYLDASRHSQFHSQLANLMLPFLHPGDHICDLGCGLGQLDLILAKSVSHITCADINPTVLDHLKAQAQQEQLPNLTTCQQDAREINAPFDVALMAFFGYPPSLMFHAMALARRLFIRVASCQPQPTLSLLENAPNKRETVADISLILDKAGAPYQLLMAELEFGQPLASREEAAAFVQCNRPSLQVGSLQAYLDEALTATGQRDFPFYLPHKKKIGVFIIDTADKSH